MPSNTMTPMPHSATPMAIQVARPTRSPRKTQAKTAANSGTELAVNRVLATVVWSSA